MNARRVAAIIATNLLVLVVGAELLGLVVYYYRHGWLFYVAPNRRVEAPREDPAGRPFTATGLHPYFGHVHAPGLDIDIPDSLRRPGLPQLAERTNNFGFDASVDFPMTRTGGDQFFVGVLGGSVAQQFCHAGLPRLFERLGQHPALRDRVFVPVCLAHEGYKQPQQLILLSYFLSMGQPFDLVVNVDGFNEVALGQINDGKGWDTSMPSGMHLEPLINLLNESTLTLDKLDALAEIRRSRMRLSEAAARVNRAWSAAAYLALDAYYATVDRRYRDALLRFQQLPSNPPEQSVLHITPRTRPPGPAVLEGVARDWTAASLLMHDMLAPRGIRYVHVLQPNQYYSSRTFSDAERAVAFTTETQFRAGAEAGYPLLERALADARQSRPDVTLLDGVHLFDRVSSSVYLDNCCHYTLAGYEALADFVADAFPDVPLN